MKSYNAVDFAAWTLTIIGGLNWGLVGFFRFDLVAALFGGQDALLSRIVYSLVGLSALYSIYALTKTTSHAHEPEHA